VSNECMESRRILGGSYGSDNRVACPIGIPLNLIMFRPCSDSQLLQAHLSCRRSSCLKIRKGAKPSLAPVSVMPMALQCWVSFRSKRIRCDSPCALFVEYLSTPTPMWPIASANPPRPAVPKTNSRYLRPHYIACLRLMSIPH